MKALVVFVVTADVAVVFNRRGSFLVVVGATWQGGATWISVTGLRLSLESTWLLLGARFTASWANSRRCGRR